MHALADSGFLRNLVDLDLQFNQLGAAGARILAAALHPPLETGQRRLRSLNLLANELGPEGAGALATSMVGLASLEDLHLGDNRLGADGVRQLEQTLTALSQLRSLNLGDNRLGREGVHALIGVLRPGLRRLGLEGNQVDAAAVRALAAGAAACTEAGSDLADQPWLTVELAGNGLKPWEVEMLSEETRGRVHARL
jgi:Ran GTPase-activating protein (RanGAP) involved in mRNA processing and transport